MPASPLPPINRGGAGVWQGMASASVWQTSVWQKILLTFAKFDPHAKQLPPLFGKCLAKCLASLTLAKFFAKHFVDF